MDFINKDQLVGMLLFFMGSGILTFCNRYEREVDVKLRDPKNRWAIIEGNKNVLLKEKNFRGTVMTLIGLGASIYGLFIFFTNLK